MGGTSGTSQWDQLVEKLYSQKCQCGLNSGWVFPRRCGSGGKLVMKCSIKTYTNNFLIHSNQVGKDWRNWTGQASDQSEGDNHQMFEHWCHCHLAACTSLWCPFAQDKNEIRRPSTLDNGRNLLLPDETGGRFDLRNRFGNACFDTKKSNPAIWYRSKRRLLSLNTSTATIDASENLKSN